MPRLSEHALHSALTELPDWKLAEGKLIHEYTFPDFLAAMHFVNEVADMAESANHHPDIDIRYNQVKLALVSHDSGGVTMRDVRFATGLNARFPPHPVA